MVTVFCALSAFAIDWGYLVVTQSELQSSADAAALAAVVVLRDEDNLSNSAPIETAISFANANEEGNGMVLSTDDVVFGNWDFETHTFVPTNWQPNAAKVTLRRGTANGNAVELIFAKIFLNFKKGDVIAVAIAAFEQPDEEDDDSSPGPPLIVN